MAYASITDVQALEAGRRIVFTSTTVPTDQQVNAFIDQIYDEINQTILRSGFQIPNVTNNYLIQTNAMGAAWLVEMAFNVSADPAAMKTVEMRKEAYLRMLGNIKENPRLAGSQPAGNFQNNLVLSDGIDHFKNTEVEFHSDQRDW